MRSFVFCCVLAGLCARDASGVTLYRIGSPLSAAERDSLDELGFEVRELPWSASQVQEALEPDSLQAGTLQPNFFDEDEDIAAGLLGRGGWIGVFLFSTINRLVGQVLLDEDPATAYLWPAIAPDSFGRGSSGRVQITLDLGGRFRIRELRLRPSSDHPEHFLEGLTFGVSDLGFVAGNSVVNFPALAEVRENTTPELSLVLDQPVSTEADQLRILRQTPKEISIADLELYGGGFVGQAAYESDVIELDTPASWGEISWSGRQDPEARVDIRSRMGTDPQPEIYWELRPEQVDSVQFLGGGGDLSFTEYKRQYQRLANLLKPQSPRSQTSPDTDNWSFWSSRYSFDRPGVNIVSPGPRQYFQLRVDFSSTVTDGGKIDYIEFKASSPPLVRELVGEIAPVAARVGEATRFTYYLNPTIRAGDGGFDGLEISTPSGVVSVDSLRIDAVDHQGYSWARTEDGLGFEILLPRRLEPTDSGALVEVVFTATVLREVGTVFAGRAFDTARPLEVRQQVTPGNALDEIEGYQLSVRTSLSSSLLYSPRIQPNPFTPNGDGVNDVAVISYKLLRLTSAAPVSIAIHDLSGRLVKRVYAGEDPLGEYARPWDGRDEANVLVPPGLYVCRIEVDVQTEQETSSSVVCVAY